MTDKVTLASIASFQNDSTAVAQYNANNTAITTAMDNTLSRDGTSPNQMGSVLDMNNNQVINLPNPVSVNSPLRLQDLNTFIGGGTIQAIPAGGNTGTVLLKNSNTNYDVSWSTQPGDNTAGSNITLSGTNPVTIGVTPTPAFTSVQTPIITGGTASNAGISISSTSNGAPGGDFVSIAGQVINLNALAASGPTSVNLGSPGAQSATLNFTGSTSGTTSLKASAVASGALTLPAATDIIVGRATTDTLTNKTISGSSNTLSNIANASLAQMANNTLKGNVSGSTTTPSDLSVVQVQTILSIGSLLVQAVNVNFNLTNSDTTIPINLPSGFTTYQIRELHISNASASISTATFGLFSALGGSGPIIAGGSAITVTSSAANTNNNYMIAVPTNLNSECYNFSNVFFRVGTPQGSAATATVTLLIYPLF